MASIVDKSNPRPVLWTLIMTTSRTHGIYRCACGTEREVCSKNIRRGQSNSCGCASSNIGDRVRKHGQSHTRLYRAWDAMRRRCQSPKHQDYNYYGARGIAVAPEWDDFATFRDWALAAGYGPGVTLDRIDPNGNYEPANCRYATAQVQSENRRHVRRYTFRGERLTVPGIAKASGWHRDRLYGMLRRGISGDEFDRLIT